MEVGVPAAAIAALLTLIALGGGGWSVRGQSTQVGFYSSSCPRAESVVQSTVQSHFRSDPTVAPGLLRLHFHDCFVRGCDASILIDGANTERTGGPTVRGFHVIDDAKKQLERACPGVVSCADILALAARDSVVLTGGLRWEVPTGRRDGRISVASETSNLPSFSDSAAVQKKKFAAKGLDSRDLVTLLGGHTIGTTSCQFFSYRLNNFTPAGGPDPSISPAFLTRLRSLCPANGDGSKRVALDTGSVNRFDISFFRNLQSGHGVLESDQKLWTDSTAKTFVQRFLGIGGSAGVRFDAEFGRSMVKMSNIQVLTAKKGEIRRVCSAIN